MFLRYARCCSRGVMGFTNMSVVRRNRSHACAGLHVVAVVVVVSVVVVIVVDPVVVVVVAVLYRNSSLRRRLVVVVVIVVVVVVLVARLLAQWFCMSVNFVIVDARAHQVRKQT